jgi:hypothetical protein
MTWITENVVRATESTPTVGTSATNTAKEVWKADGTATLQLWAGKTTAWSSVRFQQTYLTDGRDFVLDLSPWYILWDEKTGRLNLSRYVHHNWFENWDISVPVGQWVSIEIVATLTSIEISIDGQKFTSTSSAPTRLTSALLTFQEGTHFHYPQIEVEEIPEPLIVKEGRAHPGLECTVDFYDDILMAPYDHAMLDEMFAGMSRFGIKQAYWIHHGNRESGFWDQTAAGDRAFRTFDMVGDDYLVAAVESSHKANIPLIGIFKPFDTAICNYTKAAEAGTPNDALGGKLTHTFHFPAAHPELCMRRRNAIGAQKPVQKIVVTSREPIAVADASCIEIYVSNDNATFTRYTSPAEIQLTEKEVVIDNLSIVEPFLAVVFPEAAAASVLNTLPLLVQLYDADSSLLKFTYGIVRRNSTRSDFHLDNLLTPLDFREHGLYFDCAGNGVPSAVWNSEMTSRNLFSLEVSGGVLGISTQQNDHVPGMLSESEPQTHEWWLSMLTQMLDAGVDGIEIRVINHGNIFNWHEYGFNPPIVEAYRERYGIDITREEYDHAKLRALRGEFFTSFLRQASQLARSRGKRFHMHIEDMYQGPADEPSPMGLSLTWRTWIEEGLCDGVTLKTLNMNSHDSAFGRDVVALCHQHDIPVSLSPFIHSAFQAPHSAELLESYRNSSIDAFNIYEYATLFLVSPEAETKVVDEAMVHWAQNSFASGAS